MMKDSERYIITTAKASVIRDVLSLVFSAVNSEEDMILGDHPSLETFVKSGCDRIILELRRPEGPSIAIFPKIRNLRISRLGRVLVVTGKATTPGILDDLDTLRRPHIIPKNLTSGLLAPVRTVFRTLRLADPQN